MRTPDDKQQQDAQAAREEGAQAEYDAQDEDALENAAPPPDQGDTPRNQEK